jgi:Ca2+-binding RTX toxin-like protein
MGVPEMGIVGCETTGNAPPFTMAMEPVQPEAPNMDNADKVCHGEPDWDKVNGTNRADTIMAGNNWDEVKLGGGNDQLQILDGGANWAAIDAGGGDDKVSAGNNWDEIKMGVGDDHLTAGSNIKQVDLGSGNDRTLIGDADPNEWASINAGDGHDQVTAGSGFNEVKLSGGDDVLSIKTPGSGWSSIDAGAGHDRLIVDHGWDEIDGGAGNDTLYLKGSAADYRIREQDGGYSITHLATGEVMQVSNVEQIGFTEASDQQTQQPQTLVYPFTVQALMDGDSSNASLSIRLENVPADAKLALDEGSSGHYSLSLDGDAWVLTPINESATQMYAVMTLAVPADSESFQVTAKAVVMDGNEQLVSQYEVEVDPQATGAPQGQASEYWLETDENGVEIYHVEDKNNDGQVDLRGEGFDAAGDVLDLSEVLDIGQDDTLDQYLQLNPEDADNDGENDATAVAVDKDGDGNTDVTVLIDSVTDELTIQVDDNKVDFTDN